MIYNFGVFILQLLVLLLGVLGEAECHGRWRHCTEHCSYHNGWGVKEREDVGIPIADSRATPNNLTSFYETQCLKLSQLFNGHMDWG